MKCQFVTDKTQYCAENQYAPADSNLTDMLIAAT